MRCSHCDCEFPIAAKGHDGPRHFLLMGLIGAMVGVILRHYNHLTWSLAIMFLAGLALVHAVYDWHICRENGICPRCRGRNRVYIWSQ